MSGLRVGSLELLEEAGSGATSRVYRARSVADDSLVALKILQAEDGRRRGLVTRTIQELHAVAVLDHPTVAALHDFGLMSASEAEASEGLFDPGTPWLAMDWVDGTPLSRAKGALPWTTLQRVTLDVLEGLAHAHARGLVHRDVKPGNVLLQPDGSGRLLDFGLAVLTRDVVPASERTEALGTPNYMAPEQVAGAWRWFGPWTDLYGVACTVWALASGAGPFAALGQNDAILEAHLQSTPDPLVPRMRIPSGLEPWLRRLLRKDPLERPRFAADAARELAGLTLSGSWQGALLPDSPDIEEPTVTSPREDGATGVALLGTGGPPSGHTPRGLRLHEVREPPLLGRDGEKRRMWSTLERALERRRPHLLLVAGAAGVGKSRLARWLAQEAHSKGLADALYVHHQEQEGPTDGIGPALGRHLRCMDLRGEALVKRLEALARSGHIVPRGEARLVAACLDSADGEPLPEDAQIGVWLQLLAGMVEGRPLLLVVDDLQWGEQTARLLSRLVQAGELDTLPIVVVATVQDEALAERPAHRDVLAGLSSETRAESLYLSPLRPPDGRSLCEALVGTSGPLSAALAERSAGNPLFAVQLLSHWMQRHPADAGEGRMDRPGELPDDLHELWSQRVERTMHRLPEDDRHALEAAAALGLEVLEHEWLAACEQLGLTPSPSLVNDLAERRLVLRRDGRRWRFVHGMLRETILRSARDRSPVAPLHRACADALRSTLPDDGFQPDVRLRLARHLLAAGEPREALVELERAIEHRLGHDGVHAAEPLVALYERTAGAEEFNERPERTVALLLRSSLARASGARPKAIEWSASAVAREEALGHPGLASRARVELARAWTGMDAAEARGHAERARKEALRAGQPVQAAHAAAAVAELVAESDPKRARRLIDEAIDAMSGHGQARQALGLRLARAEQARRAGLGAGTLDELAEILGESRRMGSVMLEARALLIRGEVHREVGDDDRAEADYEASVAVTPPGLVLGLYARLNLSLMRVRRGHYAEALEMARAQLRVPECRRSGFLAAMTWAVCLPALAAEDDEPAFQEALDGAVRYADGSFRNGAEDVVDALSRAKEEAKSAGRFRRASSLRELIARIEGFTALSDLDVPMEYSLSSPSGPSPG